MTIKSAFILRYVKGIDDRWCYKIYQVLDLNPESRNDIMAWGDIKFNYVINLRLVYINNFSKPGNS